MREDLLQPNLTVNRSVSIYSAGALFAAAFFGGAFAVTIMALCNSVLLRRQARDLPLVALGVLAACAAVIVPETMWTESTPTDLRLVTRAGGLICWGFFYWAHKREHNAVGSMGIDSKNPWLPVICSIIAGIGLNAAILMYIRNL